ncbi:hypothetical protein PsYK624_169310 [Phanerochaete sordida]|uniref:Uncharacterized protein n=1 Tax=Phanerochaete sordida TaxID=48140 RepID=A0A9P3GTA6_9APHY|nr:hypothetical protein PsYK624_169310 [Phanerochaete sordida]
MLSIALALIGLALFALFSVLRVYALWQGSRMQRIFSGVVFTLAFVPVVTNIFSEIYIAYSLPPDLRIAYSCNRVLNASPKLTNNVIVADGLVLVLTWIKLFRQFLDMRRLKIRSSVATVLLRDGTVYFVALLAINIGLMGTILAHDSFAYGVADNILQYMPTVLIQRFMMNLRQLNHVAHADHASSTMQQFSGLSDFRVPSDLFGNVAESLENNHVERLDQDSEGGPETFSSARPFENNVECRSGAEISA